MQLRSRIAQPLRPRLAGSACGAGSVTTRGRVRRFAERLSEQGGLSVADSVAEITRLVKLPGVSVLVQLYTGRSPARVHMQIAAAPAARLCLANSMCCASRPAPEASAQTPCVLIVWARSGKGGEFVLDLPPETQRVSLVGNRRLVCSAIPFSHDSAPQTVELGRA